jgi:prepilin-type N-terminal cleavage/methylation domain-containing protein
MSNKSMQKQAIVKNKIRSTKRDQGFTLVETLIAVTILVVSVVTPLSIASQAMVYSATARDQIIASNLAQEAIDFIRNERDRSALNVTAANPARFQNFLIKFGTYNGPLSYCYIAAGCAVDVQKPTYINTGPVTLTKRLSSEPYSVAHVIDLESCTLTDTCPYLSVNSLAGADSTYIYGYADPNPPTVKWRESAFKRVVKMTIVTDLDQTLRPGVSNINTPQEVLISVTVTWRTGSYDKTLTMNEYLKSWPDGII